MDQVEQSNPHREEFLSVRSANRIKFIPKLFPVIVIFVCALVLVGWKFDFTLLKSISSEYVSVKPNTAICLILSAIALLLVQFPRGFSARYSISKVLSLVVILVAGTTLYEYFMGWDPGLDTFFFYETPGSVGTQMPGRMEPITAINLLLMGAALLSLNSREVKRHPLSHLLAFLIGTIAFLPLVGFLYGAHFKGGVSLYCDMAPYAALCFLLLACSLSLERVDHDLAAVLVSEGPGGVMARRILPVAVLLPLFIGWLRVLGERHHLISVEFGTALFTSVNIAGFFVVVWLQSVAIQRGELQRRAIQREHDTLTIENKLRGQFVAMWSHDLRNPLTAASAYAQLIQRHPDKVELSKNNAEKIIESLSRGDRMVRDMLDASRIRANQPLPLNPTDCDLVGVIKNVVCELGEVTGRKIVFEGDSELKGMWDPEAIRRAVENLCNNAVKYGLPASAILVRVKHQGDRIRLSVHNQGKVIPAEEASKLFEPFQRASTALNQGKKGWGLGLALVRGIAEAHGGMVLMDSSAETGTTFTIDLPKTLSY